MNMQKQSNLRTPWLATAAAAAALALTAGCLDGAEAPPPEPTAGTDAEARAVTVPAGADTTAALGISSWRYTPTEEGVVVRGFGADQAVQARFWLAYGEAPDEMIAHATGGDAQVTVPFEGAVRGDDAELRDTTTAFRTDVLAAQARGKGEGPQQVNDHITMCPTNSGTFATWLFINTRIRIDNPYWDKWLKFSFRAGAGYEEVWVPPAPASQYPWLSYYRSYDRAYVALPLTVTYVDSWPDGRWGPCRPVAIL
jgi:hypothetical protein